MQRLKDKVAVITGASCNLGRGIALVLDEERATVTSLDAAFVRNRHRTFRVQISKTRQNTLPQEAVSESLYVVTMA